MTKIKKTATLIAALLLCATASAQKRMSVGEYIQRYKQLAILDQELYGIPASITMAQGLLESDCGNSRLAVEANNHFGIKCKKDWTGETISHDDDAKGECFRKYASAKESYRDHSVFLDNSARYQELFTLDITDYKGWAHGLKKAGYATNPKYADLLIKIIEENKLYLLDSEEPLNIANNDTTTQPVATPVAEEPATYADSKVDVDNYVVSADSKGSYAIYYNNGSEFVVARSGDTYESMAGRLNVSVRKLRKFNDNASGQPTEGEQVYISAKGRKAINGKLIHTAVRGETLRSLSQRYGIRLKNLASMNRIDSGAVLKDGQQIRLR
jgi:LysM repeat protein